jgi:hypothetical protein
MLEVVAQLRPSLLDDLLTPCQSFLPTELDSSASDGCWRLPQCERVDIRAFEVGQTAIDESVHSISLDAGQESKRTCVEPRRREQHRSCQAGLPRLVGANSPLRLLELSDFPILAVDRLRFL